jgi:hypothetical protein
MAKMGGSIKTPTGGGAIPKLGSSNSLQNAMFQMANAGNKQAAQTKGEIAKEDELAGTLSKTSENINEQFGGNVTRGSKLTRGGATVELNPRLNADERGDVASISIMEPHFINIKRMLDEGYLDDPSGNPVKRTMRQGIIDVGQPLLASNDEKLHQIQAEFNRLKSKLPFDAGGKQLTGTEKALVFKLLNITGKDNETIKGDLDFMMATIRKRAQLALGGANIMKSESGPASNATAPSQSPVGNSVPPSVSSGQRIKVINLSNGKKGTIDPNDFNPKKYSKV